MDSESNLFVDDNNSTVNVISSSSKKRRTNTGYKSKPDKYKYRTKYNFRGESSSDYDISDEDEENLQKKPKTKTSSKNVHEPEKIRSGYSSSDENSEYEIINEKHFADESKKSETDLRLRKKNSSPCEIEKVEPVLKSEKEKSDPEINFGKTEPKNNTDGETSDDFWKSEEQKKFQKLEKEQKNSKTLSKEKCEPNFFKTEEGTKIQKLEKEQKNPEILSKEKCEPMKNDGKIWKFFITLKDLRTDWNSFKIEHPEDIEKIVLMRNRCAIGLLVIFIFCGIGGIAFRNIEGAFETFYKCGVKRVKRDFLDTLWEKRYLREDEWKSLARSKLMDFENQLYDAYEAGMNSYSGQKGWSFLNSVVFVITVVTTIGYGHMAPATVLGRIATIVYSLFGIPMFLILLADYGKLFTRGIKFLWAFVRRLYYTGSCRKVRRTVPVQEMMKGVQLVYDMTKRKGSQDVLEEDISKPPRAVKQSPAETPAMSTYTVDDEFNLPISVAFGILVIYMICGALFFSYTEEWDIFESFYFVYISISTIGFGDLVPKSHVVFMLISLVYFVFGLALTSMCINVIQEKLSDSFQQATAKIGATIGFQVGEDGSTLAVPFQIADLNAESTTSAISNGDQNNVQ